MSLERAHVQASQTHKGGSAELYGTEISAKKRYGYRCAIQECWHWCPNCGAYWCHYLDVKAALDTFIKTCFGSSARCLATKPRTRLVDPTPVPMVSSGHVHRVVDILDADTRTTATVPRY